MANYDNGANFGRKSARHRLVIAYRSRGKQIENSRLDTHSAGDRVAQSLEFLHSGSFFQTKQNRCTQHLHICVLFSNVAVDRRYVGFNFIQENVESHVRVPIVITTFLMARRATYKLVLGRLVFENSTNRRFL